MKKAGLRVLLSVAFVVTAIVPTIAQQPRLASGQLTVRSVSAGLEHEMRALAAAQASPAWIGYAVPMIPGEHNMCCDGGNGCCGTCRLEGKDSRVTSSAESRRISLESGRSLFVLFRAEKGQIQKIRTASQECELDAGDLPFYWLSGARVTDSVSFLLSFIRTADADAKRPPRLAESALAALAFHDDASADSAFDQLTATSQPESIRDRASFWLGAARGARGYQVLSRMMREDPSPTVREKVVFALSISRETDAIGTMIDAAKNDKSDHVRGQALFWLAQKAGKKAVGAITDAIENDPETEVKKKAVFALSQLPSDEGVPRLIQVARTNKNPAVRKQAMFWLGQSKDPRALSFFEEVLSR